MNSLLLKSDWKSLPILGKIVVALIIMLVIYKLGYAFGKAIVYFFH
jgi:Tfp pilus assembly protein PilO